MNDGWLTVEEARDAIAKETGTGWQIRERRTCRSGRRWTYRIGVLRCPKNATRARCKARVYLTTRNNDGQFFQIADSKSVFSHNGHVAEGLSLRAKRPRPQQSAEEAADALDAPLSDDDDEDVPKRHKDHPQEEEEVDDDDQYDPESLVVPCDHATALEVAAMYEGIDCEELRRLYPGDFSGLAPEACKMPGYRLGRLRPDRANRSFFKRVTRMESAAMFEQALREHERAYFGWWAMYYAGEQETSPLVFLRVHGVSSLEVERSLMRMQKRYACLTRGQFINSGHGRHAVFTCPLNPRTSALLAINVHALRCYRMLCVDDISPLSSMPLAPVLVQFWGLHATSPAEFVSRRFGVLSTLLFLRRVLGLGQMPFDQYGYSVMEPGFEIYDMLPEFLAMYHETDLVMRMRIHESLTAKDPDQLRFCNLVASFLFQKEEHFISLEVISRLHHQFMDGLNCHKLRARSPEAWRVIRDVFLTKMGQQWLHLDLSLSQKRKKPLAMPPAFYLYRVALREGVGLLTDELRFEICSGIIVQNIFQPGCIYERSVMYKDAVALAYYHQSFTRVSTDPLATCLRAYSSNAFHMYPLRSLFDFLRALDYHRQRGAITRVPLDDIEPPSDLPVVDGPLRVPDPIAYASAYTNLPLARRRSREKLPPDEPELAFLDDTLWVYGTGLKGDPTPAMEAQMLVRDPKFYVPL